MYSGVKLTVQITPTIVILRTNVSSPNTAVDVEWLALSSCQFRRE